MELPTCDISVRIMHLDISDLIGTGVTMAGCTIPTVSGPIRGRFATLLEAFVLTCDLGILVKPHFTDGISINSGV